ncbi:hypothetical protein ACHWQZ_G000875 [Mnemiopsis leidyi]
MNRIPLFLSTTIILQQLLSTHATVQQLFYPGTTKSFNFFRLIPELQDYTLYEKFCVEAKEECELSVHHNFDNTPVSSDGGPGTFEVSSASDEGIYTLLVKTGDIGFIIPHIVNITASYLCMKKPEDYLSRALPTVNKRGRGVVVPCTVVGDPLPSVSWRRRVDDKFVDIASDNKKYIISRLGHLFISNFSDSDVGSYSCSATNECGERCAGETHCSKISAQSPDFDLKIEDEDPDPSTDRVRYYYLNPRNVQCWTDECFSYHKASSNLYMYIKPHSDVHVEVFADIHSKSFYTNYHMSTLVKSPRFISYSDKVCYGVLLNYTNKDVMNNTVDCAAFYQSGLMSNYMAKYQLAIADPPQIKASSQLNVVEYGANFTIDFKVTRGHKDDLHTSMNIQEVACYKNGEQFQMEKGWHKQCSWNSTTNKVSILVICATDTDTGYYQVRVRSLFGNSISESFYVETFPHSDMGESCFSLRHLVLSSRSVRLEWDSPPANQSKALIYQVVIKNRQWTEKLDPTHTVQLSAVVENLHPGTPYSALVTSKGDLVGHRIQFRTHEERPGASPTDVRCEPQEGTTALLCSWSEIPLEQRNGDITSYKVRYRSHYDPDWGFNFTSVMYISIGDLEPVTLYTLQVMGCTAVGCGSAKELEVTTNEDKPSHKPRVRYIIPGVKCQETNTGLAIFHKNVSALDAVISGQGVESDTDYTVSVTPQTSQGFGPALVENVSTLSKGISPSPSFLLTLFSTLIVFDFIYGLG